MSDLKQIIVCLCLFASVFLGAVLITKSINDNASEGYHAMTATDLEVRDNIKRQKYRRVNIQCGDELFEVSRADLIPKLSEGGRTVVYSEIGKLLIIHKIEK